MDRHRDIGIGTHSVFGSSVGSGSSGLHLGFGGSFRAIGDIGVREVIGTGGSMAGMFNLGVFNDNCHWWYCSWTASACLSGCISVSVNFVRFSRDQL